VSADQDWSGGGFGKYKGLPLKVITDRFEECAAKPSMRSITAILRIAREQLEARGGLGKQPYYGIFFAGIGLIGLATSFVLPQEMKLPVMGASAGILLAAGAFSYGAWTTRKERALNLAQEGEILDRAGESIRRILEHDIPLQPLTREQRETIWDIMKRHPQHAPIRSLLEL
jgi:hypothetical protein